MKWLKFDRDETRNKMLTIRTTETCYNRISELIKFVKKTQKKNISQADLIERLIDEAWSEMQKYNKKK